MKRKALFLEHAGSLIEHEQFKTTLPKAKELKQSSKKMITLESAATAIAVVRLQAS